MITATKNGVILRKTKLAFEDESVLNPAVIADDKGIHLFYRAVHTPNRSSIGYCLLDSPLSVKERWSKPILAPEYRYESHGIEDPRIVKIEEEYYLTYVAFDGNNALGALATSRDLQHFTRRGIIVPQITLQELDRLTKKNARINKQYIDYNRGANLLSDKDVVFFSETRKR